MTEDISRKILARTERDSRGGFEIIKILDGSEGHGVKIIDVRVIGEHPEKTVEDQRRIYHVHNGELSFTINGTPITLKGGETLILKKGDVYSYRTIGGVSYMFEVCVL